MIHRANCEWPCLTIDVMLPDRLDFKDNNSWFPQYVNAIPANSLEKKSVMNGDKQIEIETHVDDDYPYNLYIVAGSQAFNRTDNKLYVMKWCNLSKTLEEDL